MNRKLLLFLSLAIVAVLAFSSSQAIFEQKSGVNQPENLLVKEAGFISCPNGPVTVQGCVVENDGCFFLNTINGRIIAIGIFGQGVGVGDEISLTGNWQTDADCASCVLNATSVTDLGDCN